MAISHAPTFLADGATGTAGTAKALAGTALRVKSVTVVAKDNNGSRVYVGGSDVSATVNRGLAAGDSLAIPAVNWLNLADVFFLVDVTSDGVDFYAVKA